MSRVEQTIPVKNDKPITVASLPDAEKAGLNIAEIGLAIPDDTPIAVLELYDTIFGWKGRGDAAAFLKIIYDSFPPKELVRILHSKAPETIPPLRGVDETGKIEVDNFIVDFHRMIGNIQDPTNEQFGLQISRRSLRQMFVGVLDYLEEKSLSLYDPTEDFTINPTEAAKIRAANFGL